MKKVDLKSLIREEIKNVLTEADLVLYKIRFKSDYSDSKNKEPKTIFSNLTTSESNKIAQYAAVEDIGGFGRKEYSDLSTRDTLHTEYMEFKDLLPYVKSLRKTKIKEGVSIGAPTQSGVGNIKVGTIVRPLGGPHKNVNHRVMYSNGPRLLIKPMGLKPGENKYKTDSTNTTSNMVRIVKEDIMGAYRRLVITTNQLDTIKKEIEDFIKRPNIKADYKDAKITIKPGVKPDVLVVDIEAVSGTALAAKISDVAKKFDKNAKIQVRREAKLSKK